MSLNLENLPASPATRGRAPKLMTARRRRLWIAVLVVVVAGLVASVLLWRYQPLEVGPAFGPVMVDTDVWASSESDIYLAEYRDGGMDFGFAFTLENRGRLPVTVLELYPDEMAAAAHPCFNAESAAAKAGHGNDVFQLRGMESLPITIAPGEPAYLRVDGHLGACQSDAVTSFATVPAIVRVGWLQRQVMLPIGTRIGWGHDVEERLSPRRAD